MSHSSAIPVIDQFAGPGGLAEGFEADGHFRIGLSVEKHATAQLWRIKLGTSDLTADIDRRTR